MRRMVHICGIQGEGIDHCPCWKKRVGRNENISPLLCSTKAHKKAKMDITHLWRTLWRRWNTTDGTRIQTVQKSPTDSPRTDTVFLLSILFPSPFSLPLPSHWHDNAPARLSTAINSNLHNYIVNEKTRKSVQHPPLHLPWAKTFGFVLPYIRVPITCILPLSLLILYSNKLQHPKPQQDAPKHIVFACIFLYNDKLLWILIYIVRN